MTIKNQHRGLGNYFQSEALPGALPLKQNSPQKVPYDLYAEQLNGSAFTCNRNENFYLWLYRSQPSVVHDPYRLYHKKTLFEPICPPDPNQIRFGPIKKDNPSQRSFVNGLLPTASNTCARIYLYQFNESQSKQFFVSHDGEFLLIPQQGKLKIHTECGLLEVAPGEIAVIPRGIKSQILGENCYGYACESLEGRFQLPNLGPIGANGLANPNDFIHPHAAFHQQEGEFEVISLYQNHLWLSGQSQYPLNVVAWKGNLLPYKYDLRLFNTINSVSFDHPDPSIFTVLTVSSLSVGTANIDFVIFPERWMVAENTFRPPYFHKNVMSEFMGLIYGQYDAKKTGFIPGGFSIHNCMAAHGPDQDTYASAINSQLDNERYRDTLAFMLESRLPWDLNIDLKDSSYRQNDYQQCWQGLPAIKL